MKRLFAVIFVLLGASASARQTAPVIPPLILHDSEFDSGGKFLREIGGRFRQPTDVTWDPAGNIFISDGCINSHVAKPVLADRAERPAAGGRRKAEPSGPPGLEEAKC